MTEKEAMEMLKEKLTCMTLEDLACIEKGCDRDCDSCEHNYGQGTSGEQKEALSIAINALEEIQKYRSLGTPEELENIICGMTEQELYREGYKKGIEECREAVEKQKAKKPIEDRNNGIRYTEVYKCPSCNGSFSDRGVSYYCYHCGQKLDFGKDDE